MEDACPPLKALLHIMANGQYQGKDVHDAEIRALFTREALLASSWYQERLLTKQARDIKLTERHIAYLDTFAHRASHQDLAEKLKINERLLNAKIKLKKVKSKEYLLSLSGTIGADPLGPMQSKA